MIKITATELKRNLSKYLTIAIKEDIIVTRYGKPIVKLCKVEQNLKVQK